MDWFKRKDKSYKFVINVLFFLLFILHTQTKTNQQKSLIIIIIILLKVWIELIFHLCY